MKSVSIFVSNDLVTDQRIHRFAVCLAEQGWEVCLIGRLKKNSKPIHIHRVQIQRVHTYFERGILFYLSLNLIYFVKALWSGSKVLMAVDLDTLPSIRMAALLRRRVFIWDSHEIFPFMPELYRHPVKQRIWQIIEKYFVSDLNNVLTVTQGVAQYLFESYGIRPVVVHNYPRTHVLHITVEEKIKSKIILFQGAINEGRCLDILIRSINRVTPGLQLVIAGDGPLRTEMESLSNQVSPVGSIRFTGELAPDQLIELTQEAFLGISLLNREHRNSWISLANKNLDYIMAALPAITVDFPEYNAINSRWPVAKLLVDVNEETVADAIIQLYHNQSEYMVMHRACLEARSVLCWEAEVKHFIAFFDSLKI